MVDPWLVQRGAAPADPAGRPEYRFQEAAEPAGRERLLWAARAAADRLCTLAFVEPDRATWVSIEHAPEEGWLFQPVSPDFKIDTAVETTLKKGFGRNHSLCHGDLATWT